MIDLFIKIKKEFKEARSKIFNFIMRNITNLRLAYEAFFNMYE